MPYLLPPRAPEEHLAREAEILSRNAVRMNAMPAMV